jgi:hypothetical protein
MIDHDLSRRPGRHSEWQSLAAAVIASTDPEENYWLESKSRLDWSTAHGVGTLGKAVLALANRDPQRASATLEGRGVVIVTEVAQLDNADLENKLTVFIGGTDGPRWWPHWVSVDEKPILVIEVDAPQGGDPPYTLRQKFGDYRASQVFVRETGKTVLATQVDTERLARRMLAKDTADTLDVVLGVTLETPLSTYYWEEAEVESFLTGEEARLMASLARVEAERAKESAAKAAREKAAREEEAEAEAATEAARKPFRGTDAASRYTLGLSASDHFARETSRAAEGLARAESLASGFAEVTKLLEDRARIMTSGLTETHKEDRSPENFKGEVARYVTGARAAIPDALRTIAKRTAPFPTFWLTNLAARNYTAVEVTIWVEGEATAEDEDYEDEVKIGTMLPSCPRSYGPWTSQTALGNLFANQGYNNFSSVIPQMNYSPPSAGRREIQNGGSFRTRFDPVDLRPGDEKIEVESGLVILVPRSRVEPVIVKWEATASNVDAIQRGEFVLPFDAEPIDVLAVGLGK